MHGTVKPISDTTTDELDHGTEHLDKLINFQY